MAKLHRIIFALSLLGFLFAGAVTTRQFIAPSGVPGIFSCVGLSIWGLSPCPYGLSLFAVLLGLSSLGLKKGFGAALTWGVRLAALAGVAFSGWVVWREICVPALARGVSYWATFSFARVPACAWGFLLFVVLGILTWRLKLVASQPKVV